MNVGDAALPQPSHVSDLDDDDLSRASHFDIDQEAIQGQEHLYQENLKLNRRLHELERQLLHTSKSKNDTSSNFELPSEFKMKWDILVQDLIMDAFSFIIEKPELLVPLLQLTVIETDQVVEGAMKDKLRSVMDLLNLKDEAAEEQLGISLKPVIQNYYKEIFKDKSLGEKFLARLQSEIEAAPWTTQDVKKEIIEQIIEGIRESVLEYFNALKNLILYMKINDPPIEMDTIPLPSSLKEAKQLQLFKFDPDQFYIVDGFNKAGYPAVILLNGPRIGNGSFAGIKPAAIVLRDVPPDYKGDLAVYSRFTKYLGAITESPVVQEEEENFEREAAAQGIVVPSEQT